MAGLNEFDLALFVAASCERHGVPVKISDPLVHVRVAVLLSGREVRGAAKRDPGRRSGSEPPDEIHSVRVEACPTAFAGSDHCMVENRCDDCGLPGEVEIGPLSA